MKEWRCKCENGLVDTVGEGERVRQMEKADQHIYTIMCKMDSWVVPSINTGSPIWHSVMTQGGAGMGRGEGGSRGIYVQIQLIHLCCTAETNITL